MIFNANFYRPLAHSKFFWAEKKTRLSTFFDRPRLNRARTYAVVTYQGIKAPLRPFARSSLLHCFKRVKVCRCCQRSS